MGWKDKVKKKSIILFVGSINKKPRKKNLQKLNFQGYLFDSKDFPNCCAF